MYAATRSCRKTKWRAAPAVARTTVARMETLAKNDMSVSVLVRLLEAAGYDLKVVAHGHARTLEDILAEQRALPDSGPTR